MRIPTQTLLSARALPTLAPHPISARALSSSPSSSRTAPPPAAPSHASPSPPRFKYDPSLYVSNRPTSLPGLTTDTKTRYAPWVHKAFGWLVSTRLGQNPTSRAIDGSRYIVGQCSDALERNQDFFFKECQLPLTVQAWFQVHLLLILMHMPRLRALPPAISHKYQSELLTHFFSLLEVRMRRTLGTRIPERMITKYMVDYGQQYKGAQLAFDVALAGTDADMAAFVWRNVFGARGVPKGTAGVKIPEGKTSKKLVESLQVGKMDGMGGRIREKDLEWQWGGEGRIGPVPTDLKSPPMLSEIPEGWDSLAMIAQLDELVGWIRREVRRMEDVPDEAVEMGFVGRVGPVKEADSVIWDELMKEEAAAVLAREGPDYMPSRLI